MAQVYIKSIVRDGNTLVITNSDCEEEIIDLCCEGGGGGVIERPDPDEIEPPPDVTNLRCVSAWFAESIISIAFAEFLVAVDPLLAGIPPYAIPSLAAYTTEKGWPTTLIAPLAALLGKWTLETRYNSIRNAVNSLPASELCEEQREIWYCTLPANNQITSAVRASVAEQMQDMVTDPCRAIGEFLQIVPIGWFISVLNEQIAHIEDTSAYECDLFDCGGDGGIDPEGQLWDWLVEETNDGWYAINNISTSSFPGFAAFSGVSEHQIETQTPRVMSPPSPWFQKQPPVAGRTMGIQYDFASAITISRVTAWGTSLSNNSRRAAVYYKQAGNPNWQLLVSKAWAINSGGIGVMDYGAPGDPLPSVPNVVSLAILWLSGGGNTRIYWNSVNYNGGFPATPS